MWEKYIIFMLPFKGEVIRSQKQHKADFRILELQCAFLGNKLPSNNVY